MGLIYYTKQMPLIQMPQPINLSHDKFDNNYLSFYAPEIVEKKSI